MIFNAYGGIKNGIRTASGIDARYAPDATLMPA